MVWLRRWSLHNQTVFMVKDPDGEHVDFTGVRFLVGWIPLAFLL